MSFVRLVIVGALAVAAFGVSPSRSSVKRDPGDEATRYSRIGACWWIKFDTLLEWAHKNDAAVYGLEPQVDFMERNTGIELKKEVAFPGYIIKPRNLRRALHSWVDWYIENYPYLYWDAEERVFRVDPDAEARSEPTDLPRAPTDQFDQCYPAEVALEGMLKPPR